MIADLLDLATRAITIGAVINLVLWVYAVVLSWHDERRVGVAIAYTLISIAFILSDLTALAAYALNLDSAVVGILAGFAIGTQMAAALVAINTLRRRP